MDDEQFPIPELVEILIRDEADRLGAVDRARAARWRRTDKGRIYRRAYAHEDRAKTTRRAYRQSDAGRAASRRMSAARQRYLATPKGRRTARRCVMLRRLKQQFGGVVPEDVRRLALAALELREQLREER